MYFQSNQMTLYTFIWYITLRPTPILIRLALLFGNCLNDTGAAIVKGMFKDDLKLMILSFLGHSLTTIQLISQCNICESFTDYLSKIDLSGTFPNCFNNA